MSDKILSSLRAQLEANAQEIQLLQERLDQLDILIKEEINPVLDKMNKDEVQNGFSRALEIYPNGPQILADKHYIG